MSVGTAEDDRVEASTDPEPAAETEEARSLRGGMVKALVAVLANVGVLTALLVYFGWVRSERFASFIGIDEAVLGMTVDDYVRRSVQSVFILPLVAAVAGIAWVAFDHWWRTRRRTHGPDDSVVVFVARWMWVLAVAVIAAGLACWLIRTTTAFVAAPLVSATGLLIGLYALSLRGTLPGATPLAPFAEGVLRGAVALLVAVGLFWTARNLAWVEGTELARAFPDQVPTLPSLEIDSDERLDLVAPGVTESCRLDGDGIRYHYRGLKYLESTGGNYFLISEQWTFDYGVVAVLPMSADGIRYTFVRDSIGGMRDAAYPPCDEEALREQMDAESES